MSITIEQNTLLSLKTTMGVGGDAKYFAEIKSIEEMKKAIEFAKTEKLQFFVIGNASNVLFSDKGYDGLVIHNKINTKSYLGTRVILGAGILLNNIIFELSQKGLSGIEKLFGVPGTIGGALFQNATAFKGCVSDYFVEANVFNTHNLKVEVWLKSDFEFSYRMSKAKKEMGKWIILDATFDFIPKNASEIKKTIQDINAERQKKPQGKSVGSFFTNPEGYYAGKLIEDVGLKGFNIGGAEVSDIHCNYLMNKGGATTEDFLKLSDLIKNKVKDRFNIELEEEVRILK